MQPLEPKPTVTVLSQHSKLVFTPDRVVSKHQHVKHLATLIVEEFLSSKKSHRVVVNQADKANNIGGFNISNFKMRYLNEYIADVIADYDQSLIGSVVKEIAARLGISQGSNPESTSGLQLSVTKFKGDVGFSLLQGDDPVLIVSEMMDAPIESPLKEGDIPDEFLMASSLTPRQHRLSSPSQSYIPTLPEFKSMKELAEVYSAFTQANLKYRVL